MSRFAVGLYRKQEPCVIDIFRRKNDVNSVEHVLTFLKNKEDLIRNNPDLRYKLVNYFGVLKVKEANSWILEQLKNKENDFILSILDALGSIGDIKSVEHLVPFTKGFYYSGIKKAAKDAVIKLQKNIPKEREGDLTMSEIENNAGELSIQENEKEGKLSLEEYKNNL